MLLSFVEIIDVHVMIVLYPSSSSIFQFQHDFISAVFVAHVVKMKLKVTHIMIDPRRIEDMQRFALADIETLGKDNNYPSKFHLQESLINQGIVFYHFYCISMDSI